jgi:hypothetical protein
MGDVWVTARGRDTGRSRAALARARDDSRSSGRMGRCRRQAGQSERTLMGAADHPARSAPDLRQQERSGVMDRLPDGTPGTPGHLRVLLVGSARRHRRIQGRPVPGPPRTAITARLRAALLLGLASTWVRGVSCCPRQVCPTTQTTTYRLPLIEALPWRQPRSACRLHRHRTIASHHRAALAQVVPQAGPPSMHREA